MDKKSKQLLKYLRGKNKPVEGWVYLNEFIEEYINHSNLSDHEISACLRYLEKQGYITWAKSQKGITLGFELEHAAHNKLEFDWIAFKKYLAQHWIAITALFLSIVSILMQLPTL